MCCCVTAAGIVGPQMVAFLQDRDPAHASAWSFALTAVLLLAGATLALFPANRPSKA